MASASSLHFNKNADRVPTKKNQRKYAKACVSERVFQDFRDNSVKEGVCYNRLYNTDLYAYK